MSITFFIFVSLFFIAVPLHIKSVEYEELQRKHGNQNGLKIGKTYGMISGTMESIILVGLWASPQPRFIIPILLNYVISIGNISIPLLHLAIFIPMTAFGAWFGVKGVTLVGMEVAETHCPPKKIVTTGVYSIIRHPQYFGWILAHIGISTLLSAWYSLLFTPVLLTLIYFISKEEERGLIKEFGQEYTNYQKRVPMLIPRLK